MSPMSNTNTATAPANPSPAHSRANPFWAQIVRHERLTKPGSSKDTRHFVLDLADSGLTYTPGDSLGAFGSNSPTLVTELIELLGFDPEHPLKNGNAGFKVLRETL